VALALDVNLWGVIHGCRAFLPLLHQQRKGHIVNTASIAALAGHLIQVAIQHIPPQPQRRNGPSARRSVLYICRVDTPGTQHGGAGETLAMAPSTGRPVVVAYLADWPERVAALIEILQEELGDLAGRIEHIGSTAIPGMAAKDVLDLQVSVADLGPAARAFDGPLDSLGFRTSRIPSWTW
jgi:hypothetical protein